MKYRIGNFVFGFLTPKVFASDGGYNLRHSYHKELLIQGHEIVWLASIRDAEQKYLETVKPEFVKKQDWPINYVKIEDKGWQRFLEARKHYKEYENAKRKTWAWYKATLSDNTKGTFPDVDFVISDALSMGLHKYSVM